MEKASEQKQTLSSCWYSRQRNIWVYSLYIQPPRPRGSNTKWHGGHIGIPKGKDPFLFLIQKVIRQNLNCSQKRHWNFTL